MRAAGTADRLWRIWLDRPATRLRHGAGSTVWPSACCCKPCSPSWPLLSCCTNSEAWDVKHRSSVHKTLKHWLPHQLRRSPARPGSQLPLSVGSPSCQMILAAMCRSDGPPCLYSAERSSMRLLGNHALQMLGTASTLVVGLSVALYPRLWVPICLIATACPFGARQPARVSIDLPAGAALAGRAVAAASVAIKSARWMAGGPFLSL